MYRLLGIQVGFTETSVEVLESAGTATVCVSISEDTVLEVFLSLAVEAKSGSAGTGGGSVSEEERQQITSIKST